MAYEIFAGLISGIVAIVVIVVVAQSGLISWASSIFILMFGSVHVTIKILDHVHGNVRWGKK